MCVFASQAEAVDPSGRLQVEQTAPCESGVWAVDTEHS